MGLLILYYSSIVMKVKCLFLLVLLLMHLGLRAQVVDRVWVNDLRGFSFGIMLGGEFDYFISKLEDKSADNDLLLTINRQMITPCAGLELSCKLNSRIFLSTTPLVRFAKSEIRMDTDAGSNTVDYKWGSLVLPLCLKLKGDWIRNTRPMLYVGGFGLMNLSKNPMRDLLDKAFFSCGVQLGAGWEFPTKYVTFVPEVIIRLALTDLFSVKKNSLSECSQMGLMKAASVCMNMVSFTLNFE